jgi:pimeloyl-ACP methyl ester carboxylesterase
MTTRQNDSRTSTTGRAPVRDGELWYEVRGAGRPVVLLHGGGTDRRLWDHEVALLEPDHLVVRYEARGHGASTSPTGNWEFHEDLRAVLTHLGIARPTLVGLSLGAATALDYALSWPDDVHAMLLAGPGWMNMQYTDPAALECQARQAAAVAAWDAQAWVDVTMEYWVDGVGRTAAEVDPAMRALCREMTLQNVLTHAAATMGAGTFRGVGAQDRLGELRCPVEVVVGSHDLSDAHRFARRIEQEVPGARTHLVEGAAHVVNLDRPDAFAQILRDVLDRTA